MCDTARILCTAIIQDRRVSLDECLEEVSSCRWAKGGPHNGYGQTACLTKGRQKASNSHQGRFPLPSLIADRSFLISTRVVSHYLLWLLTVLSLFSPGSFPITFSDCWPFFPYFHQGRFPLPSLIADRSFLILTRVVSHYLLWLLTVLSLFPPGSFPITFSDCWPFFPYFHQGRFPLPSLIADRSFLISTRVVSHYLLWLLTVLSLFPPGSFPITFIHCCPFFPYFDQGHFPLPFLIAARSIQTSTRVISHCLSSSLYFHFRRKYAFLW